MAILFAVDPAQKFRKAINGRKLVKFIYLVIR